MEILSQEKEGIKERVLEALHHGKIVVFPTDTVYGLLADATNEEAVERVFRMKQRKKGKPLSVFVKDIAAAKELAEILPEQELYVRDVWPGKVTLVLQSKHVLSQAFEKDGKIGIRIPKYQLLNELLGEFGKPLVATSANISGRSSCLDSREAVEQFRNQKLQPDLLVDAGKLPESQASSVVDVTEAPYRILR